MATLGSAARWPETRSRDHLDRLLYPRGHSILVLTSSAGYKLGSIRLFPARTGRVRMGSRILDPVPPHSGELSCARPLCQIPWGFGHFMMSRGGSAFTVPRPRGSLVSP